MSHETGGAPEPIIPPSDAAEKASGAWTKASHKVSRGPLDSILDVVLPGTKPADEDAGGGGGHGGH